MSLITISIKSIKRGPIPDDGTMGTVLSRLGNTYKDSASIVQDDATTFDVEVEEQDDPEYSFTKQGAVKVQFALTDHTPEVAKLVLGGDVVDGMWQRPKTAQVIEESYQIISQTDVLYEFPRLNIRGKVNDALNKGAAGLLQVSGTALQPGDPTLSSFRIGKYQLPVVSAGADQPAVVANAGNLVGTATAFRGEITTIKWTCTAKPMAAGAPGITTPAALATAITGLVDGVYKFQLSVTDENDFTNTDEVVVTVDIA